MLFCGFFPKYRWGFLGRPERAIDGTFYFEADEKLEPVYDLIRVQVNFAHQNPATPTKTEEPKVAPTA